MHDGDIRINITRSGENEVKVDIWNIIEKQPSGGATVQQVVKDLVIPLLPFGEMKKEKQSS